MKFREKSEDTRNFVKLKSGESIQGVFRGDLYEFRMHWIDDRSVLCPEDKTCEPCNNKLQASFKFRVNFITKEGNDYSAKVLQQGWRFYQNIRALDYELKGLEHFLVKITRHGSAKNDTSYTIIPISGGPLSKEQEEKLNAVQLNDLGHITEGEKEPAEIPFQKATSDYDIPF